MKAKELSALGRGALIKCMNRTFVRTRFKTDWAWVDVKNGENFTSPQLISKIDHTGPDLPITLERDTQ